YNFGRILRMIGRPEFMKLLSSVDVHEPAKLRVNGQVQNFDDFFTTYDVKEVDGMWRSPEERVIIW
ncbi:M13-type metalloendopeptidase, partial [Streptococcus pneumoniae]|uniref:M13-type metalloendopeptidase n=1 Tax=Streptococcus pneumoniae TaxID=1313 RepID=UPI002B234328